MPFSTRTVEQWNRRVHFYLGLYFVFFLWLFSLTGLMLNHGQWLVSLATNERAETRYDRPLEPLPDTVPLARARDVMRQLGLVGEIDLPAQRPGFFAFNTSRPGDANVVTVDLGRRRATVQHFDNGHLARFRILHTFSGSRYNQPGSERDWILTTVWVLAMDALAAGLIVMVFGGYYMWWRLKRRHGLGLVVLATGVVICGWFLPLALGR